MVILLYAFLIGCICGLRSMTAPAVVAWGAHLGWLHLRWFALAFFANRISLVIFSLFAMGELIADKLPFIPPRTQPGPLGVRILFGAMCGAALCISGGASPLLGAFWEHWAVSPAPSPAITTAAVEPGANVPDLLSPCSKTWWPLAAAFCSSPTCENLGPSLACRHHSVLPRR